MIESVGGLLGPDRDPGQLAQPKGLPTPQPAPEEQAGAGPVDELDDAAAKTESFFSGADAPHSGHSSPSPVSPIGRNASNSSPHFLHRNS
jgi:hypothetical protein